MSQSLQHRSYVQQPKYQLSHANLPHTNLPDTQKRVVNVSVIKNKSKIRYQESYQFIEKLIRKSKTGYNWRLLNPKKLGYTLVSSWEQQSKSIKEIRSGSLLWGYQNPKDGFIYVGNKTQSWKLGRSHSYYNPTYGDSLSESLDILLKLPNPLQMDL